MGWRPIRLEAIAIRKERRAGVVLRYQFPGAFRVIAGRRSCTVYEEISVTAYIT